jgi:Tol biopolymer transport system component
MNLFRVATSGSGKPQRLATVGEDGSEVSISHHAQRLVYTRESYCVNIWRLEVPDPDQRKMGTATRLIASSTRIDAQPQFSPDGKRIAFSSNRTGSSEIWICDSDGSNPQQLTSRGVTSGNPDWSPDGEQIVFDSKSAGISQVYLISINGGKAKPLTTGPASNFQPSWSRDGKWIDFTSDRGGDWQIWKVPASGGDVVRVTRNRSASASEPPDDQWLYFLKSKGVTGDWSLWKIPTKGGEESRVLESANQVAIGREGIYFAPGRRRFTGPYPIRFLDFLTREIRTVFEAERRIANWRLSVSPNGKQILYPQMEQEGSDLMLVENFR